MKNYRKTYKRKIKKIKKNKRNKKYTLKKNRKRKNIKLQKGGSLFTHLVDNNLFNSVLYIFQNFFNNFFGFENSIINPSVMKGQLT